MVKVALMFIGVVAVLAAIAFGIKTIYDKYIKPKSKKQ